MRFLLLWRTFTRFGRLLKNCAQGGDAALYGARQCSHMLEYAALVASPRALSDGLIIFFNTPFSRFPIPDQNHSS